MEAPWYIAGANQPSLLGYDVYSTPGFTDSRHDILLALVAWVENGTAPNEIIATKFVNDTAHDEVQRQRPICPYPQQAKFNGTGDPDLPESWDCQKLY